MIDINVTEPPFALLDDAGRERIRAGLDLAYYARDEVILEAGQAGEFVFVIHKGEVAELDMNESSTGGRIGHYTSGDLFGAISVINGQSRYRFVAEQETLCYL
ncbi:MAG: cyclic nucleotide-binding domain-containing protein, partial [Pseudomonadota bacterium]|nr:cyclic nucleotide-binding domain-containing protein [Pseudomonadota bacterium]